MTTQTEALTLALEALETYKGFIDDAHIIEGQWHWIDGLDNVQTAIKEALAQPERVQIEDSITHYGGVRTDEEIQSMTQKAQPEQEQEPVAYIDMSKWPPVRFKEGALRVDIEHLDGQKLYTHPPVPTPQRTWVGLTDEQRMIEMVDAAMVATMDIVPRITRSQCRLIIEAAHGIKEKNT